MLSGRYDGVALWPWWLSCEASCFRGRLSCSHIIFELLVAAHYFITVF